MAEIIRTAEDIDAADKIELRVLDTETGEVSRYHSMVQDVTAGGIVVSMPTEGRVTIPLREGTPVVASIWKGHADHRFKSRVLKRKGGRIPCLILAKPSPEDISRTLRRQYYRVETRIPVKVPGPILDAMRSTCSSEMPACSSAESIASRIHASV